MSEKTHSFPLNSCEFGVFDLDGTIVNSRKLVRFLGVKMMSKFFSIEPDNGSYTFRGVPIHPTCKKIGSFLKLGLLLDPINSLSHRLEKTPKPIKGAKAINKLKGQLYCSSSSPEKIAKARLKSAGVLKSFSLVLGRESGSKKEHLKIFARTNSLSLAQFSEKAYFVTDGPADLNLCYKNNFKACIGISSSLDEAKLKEAGASLVVPNLEELITI